MIKVIKQLFSDLGIKTKSKPVLSKEQILEKLAKWEPSKNNNKPKIPTVKHLPNSPYSNNIVGGGSPGMLCVTGISSVSNPLVPVNHFSIKPVVASGRVYGNFAVTGYFSMSGSYSGGIHTGLGNYKKNEYEDLLKDRRPDFEKMWDIYVKSGKSMDPKDLFLGGVKVGWGTARVLDSKLQ